MLKCFFSFFFTFFLDFLSFLLVESVIVLVEKNAYIFPPFSVSTRRKERMDFHSLSWLMEKKYSSFSLLSPGANIAHCGGFPLLGNLELFGCEKVIFCLFPLIYSDMFRYAVFRGIYLTLFLSFFRLSSSLSVSIKIYIRVSG